MDNDTILTLDGHQVIGDIPEISLIYHDFKKDSIIEINNRKYRLLEDLRISAEQIKD